MPNTFSSEDIQSFANPLKIGILATVNPDGQPHLTLISTLQACGPGQMTWGQFIEGKSKAYIRENPKVGFLVMSLDKNLWRGKATFTHTATAGPEFEQYNNIPMFRYNAYFGIHTVYYMDLVEQTGQLALPMNSVVAAAIETMLARTLDRKHSPVKAINTWTRGFLNKLDNLKFIGYVGADGYPVVIPTIQAQAADSERLLFSLSAFKRDLEQVPPGADVAVLGMSLQMEDVLMRGPYLGVRKVWGIPCGEMKVNWVYNSMPPNPGQIYPETPLEAVTLF
jgi:hypothetical protein